MVYTLQSPVSRRALAALAAVLTFASAASAQANECTQQWRKVADFVVEYGNADALPPAIARTMANGGCRVNGIELPINHRTHLTINSITWSGQEMDRFVTEGLPPRTLNIALAGVRRKSALGKPGADRDLDKHLATLSADISFAAHWDEATRTASLDLLSVRLPQGDYLTVEADVDNVDFSSTGKMQMSATGFSVSNAQINFETIGTLEALLTDPFGRSLWGRSKVRAERIATMESNVDLMPEFFVPPASKAAIKAFFKDTPRPKGAMRIDIQASPGLGPVRFLPYVTGMSGSAGPDNFWSILQGVQVDVTYPAD